MEFTKEQKSEMIKYAKKRGQAEKMATKTLDEILSKISAKNIPVALYQHGLISVNKAEKMQLGIV